MPKGKKAVVLQKNLKHLRESHSLSIQEMANNLGLAHRATYYSWERGDAQPNIHTLLRLAHEFDISVDELLKTDLSKKGKAGSKDQADGIFEVELIPHKAAAGYSAFYADPEWKEEHFRKIKIPFKPPMGEVRAFPIEGDSMEPKVSDGAFVVAVHLQDPKNEVIPGKDYIVVTRDLGIMYKIFFWKKKQAQLVSLNYEKHPPIEIEGEDITQIWRYFCSLDVG
ncbi:MAG: XRE family transcriptional regulator [Cyclobacteriaceae bacterium]